MVTPGSWFRRGTALAAITATLGGWVAVELGHNHAHLVESRHTHPTADAPHGAPPGGAEFENQSADGGHAHVTLLATSPTSRPRQLELSANSAPVPVTSFLARIIHTPVEPAAPPPRSRGSPVTPPSRAPPIS